MRSNVVRVIGGIAAVALALVLLVVLKDDGGESSESQSRTAPSATLNPHEEEKPSQGSDRQPVKQESAIPTIVVRNGEPVGGVAELSFKAGEDVRIKVTSDVSDELHLHGYDLSKPIKAGGSATFDFPAEIEGIFELELEERAVPIAELQVNP